MTIAGFYIGDIAFGCMAAMLAGIVMGDFRAPMMAVLSIAAVMALAAFFVFSFRKIWRFGLAILAFFAFGMFYVAWHEDLIASETKLVFNQAVSFDAIVADEPADSGKFSMLTVSADPLLRGSITILAPPSSDFRYGDRVAVTGKIYPPDAAGDLPFAYMPKLAVVSHGNGFWLREKLIDFKEASVRRFEDMLPGAEGGLLAAIVFDDKNDISQSLKSDMAQSGTTYLGSMYGWKIGLVALFFAVALAGWIPRILLQAIVLILIFLFVLMAGADAAAARAGIMACIALVARENGWRIDIRNALLAAILAVALFDPAAIVSDIAFILSAASVCGAIYLAPAIKRLLHLQDAGFLGWKEGLCVSLAVQLAIFPIVIRAFGTFPATSIAAGMLIIILLPVTMLLGWLLAFIGFISGRLAFFIAKIAEVVLAYDRAVIRFFSDLALPVFVPFDSWIVIVVYYMALIALSYHWHSAHAPVSANSEFKKENIAEHHAE